MILSRAGISAGRSTRRIAASTLIGLALLLVASTSTALAQPGRRTAPKNAKVAVPDLSFKGLKLGMTSRQVTEALRDVPFDISTGDDLTKTPGKCSDMASWFLSETETHPFATFVEGAQTAHLWSVFTSFTLDTLDNVAFSTNYLGSNDSITQAFTALYHTLASRYGKPKRLSDSTRILPATYKAAVDDRATLAEWTWEAKDGGDYTLSIDLTAYSENEGDAPKYSVGMTMRCFNYDRSNRELKCSERQGN